MIKQELEKRNLPDLFVTTDGIRISNKTEWEQMMRPHWKKMVQEHVFGNMPPYVKPDIAVVQKDVDFGGKANWEEVTFTFEYNGKTHAVPAQLILPRGNKRCPVVVYIDFDPGAPTKYLPAEEIIDGGFGIFSVCYNDVTTDDGNFSNGLAGLFSSQAEKAAVCADAAGSTARDGERMFSMCTDDAAAEGYNSEMHAEKREGDEAGKIMYWAYMATHMMDYLLTRPEVDQEKIGISGHSRLGKTALLASALDERFAFVCPNESGCSGAALSRGCSEKGERVIDIYTRFPYWFCENYGKYTDEPDKLPLDQHCLIALSAPRAVFVGGAFEDLWADNDSQFLACAAASPVWELYGKKGLEAPDRLPECGDHFEDGCVGFHMRAGEHFHSRTDWQVYMEAVRKYFDKGEKV